MLEVQRWRFCEFSRCHGFIYRILFWVVKKTRVDFREITPIANVRRLRHRVGHKSVDDCAPVVCCHVYGNLALCGSLSACWLFDRNGGHWPQYFQLKASRCFKYFCSHKIFSFQANHIWKLPLASDLYIVYLWNGSWIAYRKQLKASLFLPAFSDLV